MDIIGMILRRSSTSSEQGQYDDNEVRERGEEMGGGGAYIKVGKMLISHQLIL